MLSTFSLTLTLLLSLLGSGNSVDEFRAIDKHDSLAMRTLTKKASFTDGLPAHNLKPGTCYIVGSGSWGLSAILYVLFEGLALLQERCPTCKFKYDHTLSSYQCPSAVNGLSAILDSDLLYDGSDEGCTRLVIFDIIEELRGEHERSRGALGATSRNSFEFGPPMGLPTELNPKRLDMIRDIHERSCPLLKRLWRYNQTYRSKSIDPMREKLAKLPQPVVGIHIRGGDKLFKEVPTIYQEGLLQGEEGPYALGAKALLEAHPEASGGSCVVIGDDWMLGLWVAQSVRKVLGCEIYNLISSDSRGHWQEHFNRGSLESRCQETNRLFTDFELLAWSNFTIGFVHSNVDEVSYRVAKCVYGRKEDSYVDRMNWDMLAAYPRVMN